MINKLQEEFKNILEENPEKYYNDFLTIKENVKKSSAIYHGKPVDFLYQGLFFSESEYEDLENLLRKLNKILDKVIKEYRENPQFRSYFFFDKLMENLILINPGYQFDFPIGRFDIFYKKDGKHIFCELNTDGASAMNEVRVIQDLISNSKVITEMKKKNIDFKGFELFYSWIDLIIKNYREFNNGIDDKPNIAILDFTGEGTEYEFKEFKNRFIELGYQTFICDPRELKYTAGGLYYKNNLIKLVYRRATTSRLIEEADNIGDFLTAYQNKAVCVIGGLVSQIIHNKVLFAVLHDDNKIAFLENEERDFIKQHIPYTKIINYDNKQLLEEIIEKKDKWILKPFDQYAGKGVYAGRDYSRDKWKSIIEEIQGEDYILQEFIEIPVIKMANFTEQVKFEDFGFLLGLYTYNKELAGLYTRTGRKNIIGSIAESFTIPNYICRGF